MKPSSEKIGILNWIKANKLLSLAILLLGVASCLLIIKEKGKVQFANCEQQIKPYEDKIGIYEAAFEQSNKVIDALIKGRNVTGYMPTKLQWETRAAVYRPDTTKPLTRNQELIVLLKLKKMMDSAKIKVDSIDKKQQKRKT